MSDEMHSEAANESGTLSLVMPAELSEQLKSASVNYPSVSLSRRQLCDLELLANGAFNPLRGFMNQRTYTSVLEDMRLPDGTLWPVPVTLDVAADEAEKLSLGDDVALRDDEGFMLAVLTVSDIWTPDTQAEARHLYGTTEPNHSGVAQLLDTQGRVNLGGDIRAAQLPNHYDFEALRHSPDELRQQFRRLGWRNVVGFHTTRPIHRMQREICMNAAKRANAHVLIHPVVGVARPGDVSYHARIQCYRGVESHFPLGIALLSLLPLAMRMAGPREALWHAIVRRNYGCTHMVVANDHASPPNGNVYAPYAAQQLVQTHADEIGIEVIDVERQVFAPDLRRFVDADKSADTRTESLSTSEFTRRLVAEEPVPSWYTYPEVLAVLRKVHPPRRQMGMTLFFTGLSGAGKSTLAKIVYGRLIEDGSRPVTLLDGDVVRTNLSSELGFSKEHRDLNVRRIGFVASEITKNRGIAICAPIAPYATTRSAVREAVSAHGAFIEVHVSTPLEVCEARDRKGLYAKARRGLIPEFTGVSDPYETPQAPELRIDTSAFSPMEAAEEIYLYLVREGYVDTTGGDF